MWVPDLTVAAICEQDGRFLLVKEKAKSSQKIVYNQPAGHIEEGESIIESVIRETREETCRHFVPKSLVGLYRLPVEGGKTYIRYTFFGSISDIDESLTLDPDIISTHWMTYDEIRNHDSLRSPLVLNCIEDYLAGKQYPLSILREL